MYVLKLADGSEITADVGYRGTPSKTSQNLYVPLINMSRDGRCYSLAMEHHATPVSSDAQGTLQRKMLLALGFESQKNGRMFNPEVQGKFLNGTPVAMVEMCDPGEVETFSTPEADVTDCGDMLKYTLFVLINRKNQLHRAIATRTTLSGGLSPIELLATVEPGHASYSMLKCVPTNTEMRDDSPSWFIQQVTRLIQS